MQSENWIALAGILATTAISILALVTNNRLHREQQKREDRIRREQQDREAEREGKERVHSPHIEFEIRCNFFGPQQDWYLVEFLLVARNKGNVQQKFKDIRLRVRGIESGQPLSGWQGREPRLAFPTKIVDDASLLPERYNFFFVEPGIEQVFTYITKVPAAMGYLLAHAEFEYDQFTPHTAERTFGVPVKV